MEPMFRFSEFDIPVFSSRGALPLWSSSSCGERANFTLSRGGSTDRSACECIPVEIVNCNEDCWVGIGDLRQNFVTVVCGIGSVEA